MGTSLQARVAARGFPVIDVSGQSGQGALPDSTLPTGNQPGIPTAPWVNPNEDPASVPATMPAPEAYVLGYSLWGLPGEPNPDDTPRTHAAPFADPTLAWQDGRGKNSTGIAEYNAELEATHAPEFNGAELRRHPGVQAQFGFERDIIPGSPAGPLQKLDGQVRLMGGFDGVQGYGGGADGINGTNATMPLTVVERRFPGPEGRPVFLNAAEVPLITADADQYIASEPSMPAWQGGGFDVPTASVQAQDVVTADSPAQGPALAPSYGLLPPWGTI